jgi:hypothetical protein
MPISVHDRTELTHLIESKRNQLLNMRGGPQRLPRSRAHNHQKVNVPYAKERLPGHSTLQRNNGVPDQTLPLDVAIHRVEAAPARRGSG